MPRTLPLHWHDEPQASKPPTQSRPYQVGEQLEAHHLSGHQVVTHGRVVQRAPLARKQRSVICAKIAARH